MRSYSPPILWGEVGSADYDLDWSFLPHYSVIKPLKKLPTMDKGFTLTERDWRYDDVSRKIMDLSSYPPVGDKAYGVVNQSNLFTPLDGGKYQGGGLTKDRVRVKDLIGSNDIQVQGLPPMGVLPVGTVMSFSNSKWNHGIELFKSSFGTASFADKLIKWTWIIVDNTNANANGLVDGKNYWQGKYTYRIQRIKIDPDDYSSWHGLYTANKTNMVDISSDILHELLRFDVNYMIDERDMKRKWDATLEGSIEINRLKGDGNLSDAERMTLFMSRWYVFNEVLNGIYSAMSDGCVKIHVKSSLDCISHSPIEKIAGFDWSGQEENETGFRKRFDFDPKKPVRSGFLIPFLPNPLNASNLKSYQQSCYPSLLWPLIEPNFTHKPFGEDGAWLNRIYSGEHKVARAWRQGFSDLIGIDLWDLDNPHDPQSDVLQYIDYPIILYILRWLNGKPSFGGPKWADYQQNTDYIYSWMGANRKPNIDYERPISLW